MAQTTFLDKAPIIHQFRRGEERIFYNAFTHRWLHRLEDEPDPDSDSLVELAEIDWEFLLLDDLKDPHLMRVEVTQSCNFKCSYCIVFQNNLEQLHTHMSVETARTLLSYYHKHMPGGMLMIMGGEPTLNWEACKILIEGIPLAAPKEYYTNGVLLDEEKINFLTSHNVSVRLSIDGFERHHHQRTLSTGATLYSTIIDRFKALRDAGCSVGINCTVTKENLPDLVDIHKYFVEDLGAKMFGYSIPHLAVNSSETESLDMDTYTKAMLTIYESCKENQLYVHQIMKRLAYLVRGKFKAIGCTVIGPEVTFYPNGRQTLCTKLDSDPKTAKVTPEEIYKSLPFFNEDCRQCPAIGVCGGGCYWDAVMRFDRFQDLRECKFQQRLVERMLWDVADWKNTYGDDFPQHLNNIFGTRMFSSSSN